MDTNTGVTGTAAGQSAGAGSPSATAGQHAGASTGSAQTAGASSAGAQNQQTQNAEAGQPQAGGQTVPLAVVTQLREKNRQLEALVNEARQQNEAVLYRLEQMQTARPAAAGNGDGENIAEADKPILDALERRIEKKFGPLMQRFGKMSQIVEMNDNHARIERAKQARERIAEAHPIYKHELLGSGAMADLQAKMAQYESMRVPVNAFEVAEEVAAVWNARKTAYDASVAAALVKDAQAARPGAGTGAAVNVGGASGPVTPAGQGFIGLRAKSEQVKAEMLRQKAAGMGAA